jgi:hypothetical protein
MIDIRIICAHDAASLAETLMRLLEAEQHRVRLTYGRQSLHELDEACGEQSAVLLIWSPNARSQSYMLGWAHKIDPARLIEVARDTSDWPVIKRRSPVIDFTNWRGQRGARAWKALNERLGAIARAFEPQKLPAKTLLAAGVAGVAAVAGAVMIRVEPPVENQIAATPFEEAAILNPDDGVGGPLSAVEPASLEDDVLRVRRFQAVSPIDAGPAEPLAQLPELEGFELRDRTLLERLNAYNPLRRQDSEG